MAGRRAGGQAAGLAVRPLSAFGVDPDAELVTAVAEFTGHVVTEAGSDVAQVAHFATGE
jgi:hypothetical protein